MKRFAMFSGSFYYPCGGVDDCQGSYLTLEEAKAGVPQYRDWAHIAEWTEKGLIKVLRWESEGQTPGWVEAE